MPELPEVETYVRELRPLLVGRRITGVTAHWPRTISGLEVDEFQQRLSGQTIIDLSRRGKYLVFHLSGGDYLLLHLKMSGRLHITPVIAPSDRHAHTVFDLERGEQLRFHDPRKFGRVYLVDDPEVVVGPLGPEPLAEDFTLAILDRLLDRRKGRLKPLLLNQTFLAGLGNIYVDEALHTAGLHPLRSAQSLSPDERQRLYDAIRLVLVRGIEARGTTFVDANPFLRTSGEPGWYQPQVYGRKDEPCPVCGTPIARILVGQRGTHLCPQCQH